MYLTELFANDSKKVLVLYPGRFQIFHRGHAAVYKHLCSQFGNQNVFIVTSNKVELPKSPFTFNEKLKMITAIGIPANKVVQSSQPYRASEIVSKYDLDNTVLVFAVSEKDMASDPRFAFNPKKDGSPSYFQPFKSINQSKPLSQHAYVATVPTFQFNVLGQPASSASQIRDLYAKSDGQTRKAIIKDLFGSFNEELFNLLNSKLLQTAAVNESISRPRVRKFVNHFDQMKYEVLNSDGVTVKSGFTDKEAAKKWLRDHYSQLTEGAKVKFECIQLDASTLSKRLYHKYNNTLRSWVDFKQTFPRRPVASSMFLSDKDQPGSILREAYEFVDHIKCQGLTHEDTIKVGDTVACLSFHIIPSKPCIDVLGTTVPRRIRNIETNSNGEIQLLHFTDGTVFPRDKHYEYKGTPLEFSIYFRTQQEAETSLTLALLKVPNGWEVRIDDLLQEASVLPRTYSLWDRELFESLGNIIPVDEVIREPKIRKINESYIVVDAERTTLESGFVDRVSATKWLTEHLKNSDPETYQYLMWEKDRLYPITEDYSSCARAYTNYDEENPTITREDLEQLEVYLNKLWKELNVDIEFTKHFLARVNDPRNVDQITIAELTRLFREQYRLNGKYITQMGPGAEAVLKDMKTKVNVPFVLEWDKENQTLDLFAKTVMRKKEFGSSTPIFRI